MTRRSSVRAQARRNYRKLVSQETPDPSPRVADARGGGEPEDLTAQSLTEKVRTLYEESAVPVREIAGLAGVTERTIYKYAAKQCWKKRYVRAPDFALERGAGARFIRRADKGKPFASGLLATDPAGAECAAAGCGAAQRLSNEAQAMAEAAQRDEATIRAIEWTNSALRQLNEHLDARERRPAPDNDPLERVYQLELSMALTRWEALQAAEAALPASLPSPLAGEGGTCGA